MTDQMINDMAAAIDSLRRQVLIAHQELRAITVQRNGYISQAQGLAARVSELEALIMHPVITNENTWSRFDYATQIALAAKTGVTIPAKDALEMCLSHADAMAYINRLLKALNPLLFEEKAALESGMMDGNND